jgi:uncharacterized RDD family membrane protein YckC
MRAPPRSRSAGTLASVSTPGAFGGLGGDIITGEAVRLDLRLARAGSRGMAFAIDAVVVVTALVVIIYLLGTLVTFGDAALAAAVATLAIVAVLIGIPVTIETATRGRSLGKLALGLRVVRDDGGPIRFRQAFVRGLAGMFEIYAFSGVPALISSLLSSRGKRIGDLLAGTVVLQERVPSHARADVVMPAPLAGWAAAADLSRITDALALSARQYLGRAPELAPAARAQMEGQLATAVAALVAPPVPPGTPGWALLAAVVAERRRREEARFAQTPPAYAAPQASRPPPPPPATPQQLPPPPSAPAAPGTGGFAPPV